MSETSDGAVRGSRSGVSLTALAAAPPDPTGGEVLGRSREKREIVGHRFGDGPLAVSLIGGCHADEPVGPWLLDRLVRVLAELPADAPARRMFTWWIVPHVNPDGEARNQAWTEPLDGALRRARPLEPESDSGARPVADPVLYARHVVRELPGDDLEFGFPRDTDDREARPETRAVYDWWRCGGVRFALHVSLHGMGVARGPWFLIEPTWRDRAAPLIATCRAAVTAMGYDLHDDARTGEKGFCRISEGFSTRPDSLAMRAYFEERGDPETAARFRPSSMETVRSLGGDPLTLVTEMPLFIASERPPGMSAAELVATGEVTPMPIFDQWKLQWTYIEAALALVSGGR